MQSPVISRRFVFYICGVVIFLYTSFGVLMYFAFRQMFREKQRYNLDVDKFRHVIEITTTNFLSQVFSKEISENPSPSVSHAVSNDFVKVVYSDYAFWDSWGRPYARLDGCDITVGDFTDQGVVVALNASSIFVRSFDGKAIVIKNFTRPAATRSAGDEGAADRVESAGG